MISEAWQLSCEHLMLPILKVNFPTGLCGDSQEAICQPALPERKGIQDPASFLGQQAYYKDWTISQTTSML